MGYAKGSQGWSRSIFGENNVRCLALCEVINTGYQSDSNYVVHKEDHVVTRYLFIFNSDNSHQQTFADDILLPFVDLYTKYK